jgi:hypothetical protein
MIRYALLCEHEHAFEAWFGSSVDYDDQAQKGLVECPLCASTTVRKQIMSPAIAGTKKDESSAHAQAMMMEALGRARRHVAENFDYVGDAFSREARDIHDGVSPDRAIYGEANPAEVKALIEDGIRVAPLPPAIAPRPKTQVN